MEDYNGNIKPRKDRNDPLQKIDCLIALVMALGRWMAIDAADAGQPSLMILGD
jgi:phage terminase large subunit-like protein